MLASEYKASLPYLLKAGTSIFVWGRHGIGKSAIPLEFCNEHDYKLFNLRLGNMADAGDVLGLADFETDAKGKKIATRFYMPDWLKELTTFCEQNKDKYAIIHLDEINRARKDLLSVVFQMALDHRLHTFEFPSNVYVICSANPPTGDYDVGELCDEAFLDRFLHMKFSPTKKEFLQYADDAEMDKELFGFLQENPGFIESDTEEFSIEAFTKPSRRTWLNGLSALKKTGMPEMLFRQWMFGGVGVAITSAFEDYKKNTQKPFTAEEILNNYAEIKPIVEKLVAGKNNREDIVVICCDNVVEFIKKATAITEEQAKNVSDFLTDIRADKALTVLREIYVNEIIADTVSKNKKLINKLKKAKAASVEADKSKETSNTQAS